jgi:hypothetical protein
MSSNDTSSNDPNTIFFDNLKRSITSIGVMILLSSVLSYITIIIKSLHNPSFETNIDYDNDNIYTNDNINTNNIVDMLNIVTSSSSLYSRIQISSNLFNPSKWIKPSEILQAYSLLFSVEPINTKDDVDGNMYFNHIYRALLAIPLLKGLHSYFNSPHIGITPELNPDLNNIYKQTENDPKLLQWDTTISQYIVYYLYSVITKSVNTNLFIYKMMVSYISTWNETILFLLYAFFGSVIMYIMGIISTVVIFITSISELPKLFSDRTPVTNYNPDEHKKIDIKWSVNSLQFLNPFRWFVVWLFAMGYTTIFAFFAFFIFLFTLFIPISLTGKVSKYFLSTKDNIPFRFNNPMDTEDKKNNSSGHSNFEQVKINLSKNINYFSYLSNFLYRNKNYIFYIAIFYIILDITLAYTTSTQLITFLLFVAIIWLLNAFNYSIDIDNIEVLQKI